MRAATILFGFVLAASPLVPTDTAAPAADRTVSGGLADDQSGRADLVEDPTAALALAEDALAQQQRAFAAGMCPGEDVYRWSKRLLRQRRTLAPGDALQALEGHANAMRDLERVALQGTGWPRAGLAGLAPSFYKAEAECLVERQRRPLSDAASCKRLVLSAAYDNCTVQVKAYRERLSALMTAGLERDWFGSSPLMACQWSARWMRSEIDLDPERRAAILAAHVARLEALARQTSKSIDSGNAPPLFLVLIESHLGEARYLSVGDASGWEVVAERLDRAGREMYDKGISRLEDVRSTALQLLRARLASHPDQKAAAFRAHVASMSALKNDTSRRIAVGTQGPHAGLAAAYYAAEAAAWLEHAPDIADLE